MTLLWVLKTRYHWWINMSMSCMEEYTSMLNEKTKCKLTNWKLVTDSRKCDICEFWRIVNEVKWGPKKYESNWSRYSFVFINSKSKDLKILLVSDWCINFTTIGPQFTTKFTFSFIQWSLKHNLHLLNPWLQKWIL